MKWKIGISGKLVILLLIVGEASLISIGAVQYSLDIRHAEKELSDEAEAIQERLYVNLSQLVYELNMKGIEAVVRSEFSNRRVAKIVIWESEGSEILFEYGNSYIDRTKGYDASRYIKKISRLEFRDELNRNPKKTDIGVLELYMDRKYIMDQVLATTAGNIFRFGSVIALLLDKLAVIIQKLLVNPLERIRAGMEQTMSGIGSDSDSGDMGYMNPVKLHEDAFKKGFTEIKSMAECFEKMSLAITERQNEISAGRDSLRITLESIGDAVITTDTEGRIRMMNPVAERITGFSSGAYHGRSIADVLEIKDSKTGAVLVNPVFASIGLSGVVPLPGEASITSPDGSEISISGTSSPIRNSEGKTVGAVLVFRDITHSKRIDEQLHQARKMDVIGQLAGGIAHDFNNMLGGIIGNAELLSFSIPADSTLRKYVDTIIKGAERAADLTRKLLAFSRKAMIVTTPLDIHEQIRAAISLLERSIDPRIKIITKLDASSRIVASDPTLIQNAFLNLAINARDAMPEGGAITFSTSNIILDHEYCRKQPYRIEPGMYLEISVSDTGCGMTKDVTSRIFEPFFTTKPVGQGTGLGLSAVYGTVKDHNGSITVYSEPGLGTVFKIYLPVDPSSPVLSERETEKADEVTKKNGCILVVDDEAIIRTTAQALISAIGYEVLLAEDGDEAIETFLIERERISAILLDIVMPKMNGRDVYLKIREIDPDIPVIFSSGFSSDTIVSDLTGIGAVAFIQKPYRQGSVAKALDEALNSR
jgi:PAS domain S-box-containing protein